MCSAVLQFTVKPVKNNKEEIGLQIWTLTHLQRIKSRRVKIDRIIIFMWASRNAQWLIIRAKCSRRGLQQTKLYTSQYEIGLATLNE